MLSRTAHVLATRLELRPSHRNARRSSGLCTCAALAVAVFIPLLCVSASHAGSFYWTGNSAGGPIWNSTIGGTNWSVDPNSVSDPATFPGSADDVFFVFNPENNATTTLGQDFSIKGLTFTSDATSPVTIGGANTLTIGTDGLTLNGSASDVISANVAVEGAQTWANNSPAATTLTVSGQLSGSAALTLEGTGSVSTPSGSFVFTGNNSYTGAITLLNANTTLTLSGSGTLASASSITLGGGTSLILDNTLTSATRLNSAMPINSNGGTIRVLGNSVNTVTDGFGALNLTTGATSIGVIQSSGPTTTLRVNSISRLPGAAVNFAPTSSSAVVALTNSTLSTGILGSWATIGDQSSGTGVYDWATVSAGNIVPYSSYNTSTTVSTWAGTNVQTSFSGNVNSAIANSLYITGGRSSAETVRAIRSQLLAVA